MREDEQRRAIVLQRVTAGAITLVQASEILRISYRQMKRVWKRWNVDGVRGLEHKNRGRPSNRSFPPDFKERIYKRYVDESESIGPSRFARKLAQEGITVDHETLRRWLLKNGMWTSKQQNQAPQRHSRTTLGFGELLSLVSMSGRWLGHSISEGYLFCLRDESTGTILAWLSPEDSAIGAMHILWCWINRYGIPVALRCRKSLLCIKDWRPSLDEQLAGVEPRTPLARSCDRLGVATSVLNPSQSKTIVQELDGFLASARSALARSSPSTYHDANQLLEDEMFDDLNELHAPSSAVRDFHVQIIDGTDLRKIFCVNHVHFVRRDSTVYHDAKCLRLLNRAQPSRKRVSKVVVSEWLDGSLHVLADGADIPYAEVRGESSRSGRLAM